MLIRKVGRELVMGRGLLLGSEQGCRIFEMVIGGDWRIWQCALGSGFGACNSDGLCVLGLMVEYGSISIALRGRGTSSGS